VLLCHVMLNMEGAELAEKVKTQLSMVEDQVRFGDWSIVPMLIFRCSPVKTSNLYACWRSHWARLRSKRSLQKTVEEMTSVYRFLLAKPLKLTDVPELAQRHLRSALSRANQIKSRGLVDRLTSSLALIAQIGNDETDKEEMTELWAKQQTGDTVRLADEREQIKQFGRMVRMVGLRVAEGWC
jgi:replicative DNA helicase